MTQAPPNDTDGPGGHGIGHLAVLNTVLSAVLAAGASYGIALLVSKRYSVDWYTHGARRTFEEAFVLADLASGAFATAVVTVVLVSTIVLWQWDRGAIRSTRTDRLALSGSRTRVMHVLVTALQLGAILSVLALLNALVGFGAVRAEVVSSGDFALIRAAAGGLVAAVAAAYTTVSLVVNLSKGKLTRPDHDGNLVSRLSLWSSENAGRVVAAFLLATLLLGAGIPAIDTEVDAADVLPRGNPHTRAARNVSDEFKSTLTQQVTFQFTVNPDQCRRDSRENLPLRHPTSLASGQPQPPNRSASRSPTPADPAVVDQPLPSTLPLGPTSQPSEQTTAIAQAPGEINCGKITDEVYVRAIDEFFTFLKNHSHETDGGLLDEDERVESPFTSQIGLPSFFKLINWTRAGGQDDAPDAAYALPGPAQRTDWQAVNQTTWASLASFIEPVLDPDHEQAAVLYLVPADSEATHREIGAFAIDAREAYLEWEGADYQVFQADEDNPRITVSLPVANAHGSQLVQEDLKLLMPLVAYVIVVALYAAFRDLQSVLVAGSALSLAVVWTYGAMGWMGIALNPLNLLVVPLILGSGIDYAIHMINEFQEHKSEGLTDAEAFLVAGKRAGLAMFLATVITVGGLLVMVASPSLLMAQLGGLSAIAIASVYLLTVSFIPAVLTLAGGTEAMGANFKPSTLIPRYGRVVSNHRIVFGLLLVLATAGAAIGMADLEKEEFGEPALNWPEDDPMRREHEAGLAGFYNSDLGEPTFKANIMVVEGDATRYETHRYLDALKSNLSREADDTDVVNADTSRHLPFVVRSWLKIRDGPESVPAGILSEELGNRGHEENNLYPKTHDEIRRTLDNMAASPYSEFSGAAVNHPDHDIAPISFSVRTGSFDRAEEAWDAMSRARENAEPLRPDDAHTSFVGNTATNFLFVEEELPWLNIMSYVAFGIAVLLVLAFTRSLRATITAGLVLAGTSVWLLGILPLVDIGLAITLMLPLVFVFNIGSDYVVHFLWNIEQVGDVEQVFSTVGKAVFFSALTDIAAFLMFTSWVPGLDGIRNLMAREAMEATVIAVAVTFLGTVTVTALFYKVRSAEQVDPEAGAELAGTASAS